MAKLTIADLKKIKEDYHQGLREGGFRVRITVHMGTCGIAAGARGIMNTIMEELAKSNLKDVAITTSGCAGLCSKEPMATIETHGRAAGEIHFADGRQDAEDLCRTRSGGQAGPGISRWLSGMRRHIKIPMQNAK